jgi:hypothetical protein
MFFYLFFCFRVGAKEKSLVASRQAPVPLRLGAGARGPYRASTVISTPSPGGDYTAAEARRNWAGDMPTV